ncbi:hypothetical protein PO883_10485 [Massilia sp. DJPM01]|uniref:DUF6200 domain-containing protein n=1 Tax=Massilia TaxID=149698 RepID=UPI001CB721FC|nr:MULTISPECIES: hypothetical protein [Massilia]MDM5177619.1 hypothetical protein [Massilia sp. DJPM01]
MKSIQSSDESGESVIITSEVAQHDAPLILDLGTRKKKQVKGLRRGEGKLMNRISIVLDELKKSGQIAVSAQPIVLVVREKREKGLKALFKS